MEPENSKTQSIDNEYDQVDGQAGSRLSQASAKALETCSATKLRNPVWPMKSSQTNYEIVSKEYAASPLEKYVAASLGDELPKMRDELIQRKQEGEGFVQRHAKAWSKPGNWKVDTDNESREKEDPIQLKGD